VDRREVLAVLATGAGLSWEMLAFGQRLHAEARVGNPRHSVLDQHQRDTITVAAEHIIPTSDTPGATDANVTAFIDRMLADWYAVADRDRLLAGLAELDDRSRILAGRDFLHLAEADQTALLTTLDGERERVGHWFATLKFLTAWGYCTSEVAMRNTLGAYPLPMRYDACAPYESRTGR
jgi:glucoside 3-dehydrogenase (cytochrome c) hitch-hiker subunit